MHQFPVSIVVFDAVGTLIYPDPGVASAYTIVGRRYGSGLSEVEVARRFCQVFGELEARDRAGDQRTSEETEYSRWREVVRRVLDDVTDLADCFAELYDHFARPDSWRLFPEVRDVLAALRSAGLQLAIASNFDCRLLKIAGGLEPLAFCRPILCSSQIGYRKPHPEFFRAVARALVADPGKILYVGDDPHNDVVGAESLGFQTMLVNRNGPAGTGEARSLEAVATRVAGRRPGGGCVPWNPVDPFTGLL